MSQDAAELRQLELERREREIFEMSMRSEDEEDNDFSLRRASRPVIPDTRLESQFHATVEALRAKGASQTEIFLSAVVKDFIILPFLGGFTWSLGSHLWQWYRVRATLLPRKKEGAGRFTFVRNSLHGLSGWFSSAFHALVHIPTITQAPAPAPSSPSL